MAKSDGSTHTNTYNEKQRLVSTVIKASTGKVIFGFEYTFNDMEMVSCGKKLAKNKKICYTYDTLSRAIQ